MTGLLFAWALTDRNLLERLPAAPAVDGATVLDEVSDAVLVVGPDRRVVECNGAARAVARVEDPVGRPLAAVMPALDEVLGPVPGHSGGAGEEGAGDERSDPPGTAADGGDGVAADGSGDPVPGEYPRTVTVEDGDGRTRHFDVRVSAIQGDRYGRRGVVVTLSDVTAREVRDQRLDVLNRVLRHNVRQEVMVILGHAEVIADGDAVPDPYAAHAETIEAAARSLDDYSERARLVEGTLAAVESGDPGHPADLTALAREAVADARERHPGLDVSLDVPPGPDAGAGRAADGDADAAPRSADGPGDAGRPVRVLAPPAIGEAVGELLDNAVEHAGPDPAVEVSVGRDDRTGAGVLSVADDGPGIPEAEARVFERGTETDLDHASGLGLWLVTWVVEAGGGEVTIDRPDDGGTAVSLRLPLASGSGGVADRGTVAVPDGDADGDGAPGADDAPDAGGDATPGTDPGDGSAGGGDGDGTDPGGAAGADGRVGDDPTGGRGVDATGAAGDSPDDD